MKVQALISNGVLWFLLKRQQAEETVLRYKESGCDTLALCEQIPWFFYVLSVQHRYTRELPGFHTFITFIKRIYLMCNKLYQCLQTYIGSNQLVYVAYIKSIYLLFVFILMCVRSLNLIYSERISISQYLCSKKGHEDVQSREIFVVTAYRARRLCSIPEFVVRKNK